MTGGPAFPIPMVFFLQYGTPWRRAFVAFYHRSPGLLVRVSGRELKACALDSGLASASIRGYPSTPRDEVGSTAV